MADSSDKVNLRRGRNPPYTRKDKTNGGQILNENSRPG
jgi:hypothetical protein